MTSQTTQQGRINQMTNNAIEQIEQEFDGDIAEILDEENPTERMREFAEEEANGNDDNPENTTEEILQQLQERISEE